LIYFKCNPTNEAHQKGIDLLFADSSIQSFSEQKIAKLFLSKLDTYKKFPDMAIPTVEVGKLTSENLEKGIEDLKKLIRQHPHKDDFASEFILKDNVGSSGISVFKINPNSPFDEIAKKAEEENETGADVWYVLQPLVNCEHGFVIGPYSGMIDLRLWMINNDILNTSIRIAKSGEFRANVHQGGTEIFLEKSQVPQDVFDMAEKIRKRLDIKSSFYALDFIRSNNGNLYFIEGNSSPGIDWTTDPVHEARQKKTIERLVEIFTEKARKNQ
jgi:glutathione synthase/RimK-type ligase-like ATP-grasp enzyme